MPITTLGTFNLGNDVVSVRIDPKLAGARFNLGFSTIRGPGITIGLQDCRNWETVLECLLHEAIEYAWVQLRGRYVHTEDESGSSGAYLFIADHELFTEIVARAAAFVAEVEEPIRKHWNRHKKEA